MIAASQLRRMLELAPDSAVEPLSPRMPVDAVYEHALRSGVQVIAAP